MTHDLNGQQPCDAGDRRTVQYGHELVGDGGTHVPGDGQPQPIDPATRALIHVHRALNLEQREIATRLGVSRSVVSRTLCNTRDRVEDGADPLDVYADVLAHVLVVEPPDEQDDADGYDDDLSDAELEARRQPTVGLAALLGDDDADPDDVLPDGGQRPAECECDDWNRMVGWSCIPCNGAGFDTPASGGGGR